MSGHQCRDSEVASSITAATLLSLMPHLTPPHGRPSLPGICETTDDGGVIGGAGAQGDVAEGEGVGIALSPPQAQSTAPHSLKALSGGARSRRAFLSFAPHIEE